LRSVPGGERAETMARDTTTEKKRKAPAKARAVDELAARCEALERQVAELEEALERVRHSLASTTWRRCGDRWKTFARCCVNRASRFHSQMSAKLGPWRAPVSSSRGSPQG
jgi:hypothetical protein